MALMLAPYWAGALTPSGQTPRCTAPQVQVERICWCSTVRIASRGSSNTWRVSAVVWSCSSRWQTLQWVGAWWTMVSSTWVLWRRVLPLCPGWPPLEFLPDARSDFGAGLDSPSLDGGLLEFLLLSANRPSSSLMRSCITSIWAMRSCTCCCKGHSIRIRSSFCAWLSWLRSGSSSI